MKYFTALVTLAVIAIGCSHAADYPVTPKETREEITALRET